jgi:hypothetical protein
MCAPSRTGKYCCDTIHASTNKPFSALRPSFDSTICVVMSAYTPAQSLSNAHGEFFGGNSRHSLTPIDDSGKGFARGDALMRHRQRGICAGSLLAQDKGSSAEGVAETKP